MTDEPSFHFMGFVADLAFTGDGKHLVSLSSMPDCTVPSLDPVRWTGEKVSAQMAMAKISDTESGMVLILVFIPFCFGLSARWRIFSSQPLSHLATLGE